jgi:hypothetical protein
MEKCHFLQAATSNFTAFNRIFWPWQPERLALAHNVTFLDTIKHPKINPWSVSENSGERAPLACRGRRPADHFERIGCPFVIARAEASWRDAANSTRDACAPISVRPARLINYSFRFAHSTLLIDLLRLSREFCR